MKTQVVVLFPFDLGLELDFTGKEAQSIMQSISEHALPTLSFGGRLFPGANAQSHIYRFGTGIIQISFPADCEMTFYAELACSVENIHAGSASLREWCHASVSEIIRKAQKFAIHRYDMRLRESDFFPIFFVHPENVDSADSFIRKNYKALYGIVAGEPNFDQLSNFVFQKEPLGNFGYYENEVILLKRFGALISSAESGTIIELIALAYAQYWNLKSYHYVLDSEIDTAQKILADLPPYYKFWKIPARYQRFSTDAIDFAKDKLAIVESLYNVSSNIPRIESDWHLRTIYDDVSKVFGIGELYRTVEVKLDRIEEAYNQAREFLSTNFFILLDIVFFLWLGWGVVDTLILLFIARK